MVRNLLSSVKPTNKDIILLANGFHSQCFKNTALPPSQLQRVNRICDRDANYVKYVKEMMKRFRDESQTLLTAAKEHRLCKIKKYRNPT